MRPNYRRDEFNAKVPGRQDAKNAKLRILLSLAFLASLRETLFFC